MSTSTARLLIQRACLRRRSIVRNWTLYLTARPPFQEEGSWRSLQTRPLQLLLLASALARRLCFLHPFCHLRFHSVKVEARAPLHRWVIDEGLEFLGHHLLDEHKTPELELEPIEVLLRSFFRSVAGPTLTLKWIESKVDQV